MPEVNTNCPMCGQPMIAGIIGVNGQGAGWARVVWELPSRSLFRRSIAILRTGFFGGGARRAWRCEACHCVLLPPDDRHDPVTGS